MIYANDHQSTYRAIRRLRGHLVVLAISLAILGVVSLVLRQFWPAAPSYVFQIEVGVYGVYALLVVVSAYFYPCPRCDKYFFSKRWICNPLASECQHCRFKPEREK